MIEIHECGKNVECGPMRRDGAYIVRVRRVMSIAQVDSDGGCDGVRGPGAQEPPQSGSKRCPPTTIVSPLPHCDWVLNRMIHRTLLPAASRP